MADTESGNGADELYRKVGFVEVGKIPRFAHSPAGGLRDETFFYKDLSLGEEGHTSFKTE